MERAEHLIEKLRLQLRAGEPVEQLLTTLRILYAEIRGDVSAQRQPPMTGPVAVIMPATEGIAVPPSASSPQSRGERVVQPLEVDETELEAELHAIREAAELRNASSLHLPGEVTSSEHPHPVQPASMEDAVRRTIPAAEGQEPDSLNDRLGSREREVSERLAEEPVQDLRKAISLNDRFRFASELFQGDHSLYEDAIRALNGSTGLGQAMQWLEAECFRKLGWKEDDPLCAQFVSLVRRRFLST